MEHPSASSVFKYLKNQKFESTFSDPKSSPIFCIFFTKISDWSASEPHVGDLHRADFFYGSNLRNGSVLRCSILKKMQRFSAH